ncbi:MAG: DUF748 domain-containing protein [Desulfomonilia bacterium]
MRNLRNLLLFIVIIFAAYSLAGFLVLPPILKSMVVKNLSQSLDRPVSIERVKLNPYKLSLTAEGICINDQDGTSEFVSVNELFLNLQSMSALKRALIVRELKLVNPCVHIVRVNENTFNFSDLFETGNDSHQGTPLKFSVENIQVFGGRIDVEDTPIGKHHVAHDITIAIPFISNIDYFADVFVQPRFEAMVNGKPVFLQGETKPFHDSLETTLNIDFKQIDIPYYLAYIPQKFGFKIPAGRLDIEALLIFMQYKDRAPTLEIEGTCVVKNLAVMDMQDQPMLGLPELLIQIAPSRPLERQIHVERIALNSPQLAVTRLATGSLNLELVGENRPEQASPVEETPETNPLSLAIDAVDITDGSISFTDLSTSNPVKLDIGRFSLNTVGISTTSKNPAELNLTCTIGEKGSLSAQSSFLLNPLSGEVKLDLRGVELSWFQPYLSDRFDLIISRGSASTTGTCTFTTKRDEEPRISFTGNVQVVRLASVDRAHAEDFARFSSLSVKGISLSTHPNILSLSDISLVEPYVRITLFEDGSLNIRNIFSTKTREEQEIMEPNDQEPEQEPAFQSVTVGKVYLNKGTIAFQDRSVKPEYTSELSYIDGSITGLSSEAVKRADVALSARLNNHSPLSITGSINPLQEDLFVDLTASLTDIDLSPATPYSGKYVGYTIRKGKLSLDLDYLIEQKTLESTNTIIIDQLTFGEPVESPDSMNLPVKLATALLKDRQGRINLDLPVTGRTDDPEFRVGKVILQMIVNIVTKAAASPFGALSALYPGAEQLQHIEFPFGSARLSDGSEEKIQTLTQILADKPSLSIEIQGSVDMVQDRQALVTVIFERKLKAQKLADMLKKGMKPVELDEITIPADEFEAYLEMAYKAETFPKPKNVLGLEKSLPAEEMKNMIMEHITVGESELRTLAMSRAQAIQDSIAGHEQVGADRIFLIEPTDLTPETIEGVSSARVSLTIQ